MVVISIQKQPQKRRPKQQQQQIWNISLSCSLLVLLLLFQQPIYVTAATTIDCGCPSTCTSDALEESNAVGSWKCLDRIEYLMTKYDLPEVKACWYASQPSVDYVPTKGQRQPPCRYDACHPQGCNNPQSSSLLSTLTSDEIQQLSKDSSTSPRVVYCGCPYSCNDEVLGERNPGLPFTCAARLGWFIHHYKTSQHAACTAASDETACDFAACHPEACGSDLPSDASQEDGDGAQDEDAAAAAAAQGQPQSQESVEAVAKDELESIFQRGSANNNMDDYNAKHSSSSKTPPDPIIFVIIGIVGAVMLIVGTLMGVIISNRILSSKRRMEDGDGIFRDDDDDDDDYDMNNNGLELSSSSFQQKRGANTSNNEYDIDDDDDDDDDEDGNDGDDNDEEYDDVDGEEYDNDEEEDNDDGDNRPYAKAVRV